MDAIIFDTETTGISDPVLVEAAYLKLKCAVTMGVAGEFCQRYNPGKPIGFGAMATHHITNEDVADCPPASEFKLPENVGYLIGHNIDFDWSVIGKPDIKRICTLAMARKAWPDCDSHSQGALMYKLEGPEAKYILRDAHSASHDIRMCMTILCRALDVLDSVGVIDNWEDLWLLSEQCRIPDVMPFGKHKGMKIEDLPSDYVSWLKRQPDIDPYLLQALN